ncbi:MAG: murein biosynthesis integral membrane protein MurJ [Thermoanaerobaculia bacterium]
MSIEPADQKEREEEPGRRVDRHGGHGAGYAILVALGIFLSRVAGLIRQRVFAHYFGKSMAAGIFQAGLRIPNFLQNLFGEGVLSAAFIPVYSRLLAEGDEETAGRVAGAVAALLALIISVIVLIAVLTTPWIVNLIVPGFEGVARDLTIRVVRILFPGVGLLVLSAWCLGVLNSHRKFFLSYVAPVLWNAAMITTMIALGGALRQADLAVALAWGTVVGSGLQFGVQLPFVFRYAPKLHFRLDTLLRPVRTVIRNTGPVILSRGVVQISAYVDQVIASYLQNGPGAVAILGYAQTLYLLPISLFGMSVAAAELPQMSSAVGTPEEVAEALRRRLSAGVRQIAFFVIPTVVGFLLVGRALVAALYQTGHFGGADSVYVWYVLAGSTIGLLAVTRGRLYNSAFYALHDTKTPLWFAMIRVTLTALLGFLFAFPLRPVVAWVIVTLLHLPAPRAVDAAMVFGTAGLTASAGMSGWLEYLLLRRAMQRRIGRVTVALKYHLKLWGSALIAGAASLAAYVTVMPRLSAVLPSNLAPVAAGAAVLAVFAVIYLPGTWLLGVEESSRLVKRLRRG